MKKSLFLFAILFTQFSFSQCFSCYSLENALQDPTMVKELILVNKGLTEIPKEIQQFHNLELLNLSQNKILSIDDRLNNCLQLKQLDLSRNIGLSLVTAADSFYQLPYLKSLNLNNTSMHNLDYRIGQLEGLEKLLIANNSLETIPQTLSDAPKLSYLDISNNSLKEVHMAFADLWQLAYLDISGNFTEHNYETFRNLQHKDRLKTLRCSLTEIDKNMAACLNTTGIEELIIIDSKIEKMNGRLVQNQTLKKITFENSTIEHPESIYRKLNAIKHLEELTFVQTAISPEVKDLNKVKILTIENSQVPMDALSKNKSITSLAWTDDKDDVEAIFASIQGNKKAFSAESKKIPVSQSMKENRITPIVEVEPDVQKINASEDVVLKLTETECAIQKETFLRENGEVYSGEVTVSIKEYFDPVINALAGAPMTAQSETGGDEIFASNGMIEFSAKDDRGNDLKIDPEKPVQITLRDVQPNVQPNLFVLQKSTRTWTNIGQATPSAYDSLRKVILDSLMLIPDDRFSNVTSVELQYVANVRRSRKDAYAINFWTPKFKIHRKNVYVEGSTIFYNSKRTDMRYLTKKTWYLDTVVTEEMDNLFKEMRKNNTKKYTNYGYYSNPRLLQNVRLVPDLQHDNYRMSLVYKGKLISYPVYSEEKGSLKSQIAKQKYFYKKYSSRLRKHDQFLEKIRKERAKTMKILAQTNRESTATMLACARLNRSLANNLVQTTFSVQGQQETLSFGIPVVGMYNCDYFYRAIPDYFTTIPDTLLDQNGNRLQTPEFVRYIVLDDNAYFELSREKVPMFNNKKSLVILVLSAIEIAVITSWEFINDRLVPVVKRINIEDKNPQEIRKEIFQP